ncbi:hypothetical protein [Streptomyces sp. 4N124]|uniref:hypothetical protein n=1 Tax=Streptomyces sp. 4N124 TaxID=3457420 RepID=UPI003FD0A9B2
MPSSEVEELMTRSGTTSRRPGQWTGSAEAVLQAYAELRQRGIQCYLLHEFRPDDTDQPENYGALLPLNPEGEADVREDFPVLLETDDEEVTLANRALLALLAPLSRDVEWVEREGSPLWELVQAPRLPEPVSLVTTFGLEQGTTGLWMISHDGRMVLTKRNLNFLGQHGIAWSDSYEVSGETYPVAPSLVFGGKVTQTLVSHGVEFSDPPIYLIDEVTADAVDTGNEEGS